jgi:hypothetical protein
MSRHPVPLALALAIALVPPFVQAKSSAPFDEQTLDRIAELNEAIADHYEELRSTTAGLDAQREIARSRIAAAEQELESLEVRRSKMRRLPDDQRANGLRALEEHKIDAKSRYLEALAEKHSLDLESVRAFETHATGILINLERLADALESAGGATEQSDRAARTAFQSLQYGTAVALSVLEEWGTLTRDDPRFRALWATARVLNRNVQRLSAPEGLHMTVALVRERTFVVRSLIDQARALSATLDRQGLLLQVAAQNQMLRLHFARLGAIRGLELPDLDLEDSTRRILEDIEEEPFETAEAEDGSGLPGFEDCLSYGICN